MRFSRNLRDIAILLPLIFGLPSVAAARAPESLENGWYQPRFPVPVLHVEGSIEEVAKVHGLLLARHPQARETLDHFAGAFSERLNADATLKAHPIARWLLGWGYRHFVRNPMIDSVPRRYRNAFKKFAMAAGIDEDRVLEALVLPDASLRLVSLLYGLEPSPLLPQSFGCTSVIWNSGPSSALHGRNLDYEGVGYWDRHPLIMHVIPRQGLAYVAVTALGVPATGITAFNEAGLTLAVHQLTLSDTQSAGTPVAVISAEIIRDARSIDDAIAIIRGFPRAGGWAYVLSQGRDRAVVEASATEVAIRRTSEPFFFQTNHVSSPALAASQIFYSPGSWLDTFTRAGRLSRLMQTGATRGWATPERMASILGLGQTKHDPAPIHRVAGGTINKLDNIQSVIMDATHRRLWVAIGTDSKAPNENTYVEYRWSDLRSADEPELTGAEVSLVPEDALGRTGAKLRGLLRQATNQKRLAENPDARHALLSRYVTLAEDSRARAGEAPASGRWPGIYLYVWNELKRGREAGVNPAELRRHLDIALRDSDLTPSASASLITRQAARHRLALGRLTRARLLDLEGRRSEALYEYYLVKRMALFERLKKAAERGLRRTFTWEDARAMAVDFAGIDLYRY